MNRHVAALLVILSAGAVLVLELLSARMVAPYVGAAHEVYTASIGVALGAIAVGAALGGRAADIREGRLLVGWLFVAGGALALLARPIVLALGPAFRGLGPLAAVILVGVSVALPIALLSAIAPVIVRTQLAGLTHAGRTVGWFSALGTAGGLAGTFLTGYVMLAALPQSMALLGTGVLLIGLGVWQLLVRVFRDRRKLPARAGRNAALLGVLALLGGGLLVGVPSGCTIESAYYCARVVDDPQRSTGEVLMLDDMRHAYVDRKDPTYLEFAYVRRFADVIDVAYPDGKPVDALHVGGGGLTVPRWLEATHPGTRNTVLELDGRVIDLVRDDMGVRLGPNSTVRTGDARVSIVDERTDSYDVVVSDAFSKTSVPQHLATREFQREVRRVLKPDGILVMNLIDYPPLDLLSAELATLKSVYGPVRLLSRPDALRGDEGANFVLVAGGGLEHLDPELLAAKVRSDRKEAADMATDARVAELTDRGRVLTDDWAPVDQLLSQYS